MQTPATAPAKFRIGNHHTVPLMVMSARSCLLRACFKLLLVPLLFSVVHGAESRDPKAIFNKMIQLRQGTNFYQADVFDRIRKEPGVFFERRGEDGLVETISVAFKQGRARLQNRGGKWIIRPDEVLKLEFKSPDELGAVPTELLIVQEPADITFSLLTDSSNRGKKCYRIRVTLSPELIDRQVKQIERAFNEAKVNLKNNGLDPSSFVQAQRDYYIGIEDSLCYGTETRTRQGHLISDFAYASHRLGVLPPENVFELPSDLPTVVLTTAKAYYEHLNKVARTDGIARWAKALEALLSRGTNSTANLNPGAVEGR